MPKTQEVERGVSALLRLSESIGKTVPPCTGVHEDTCAYCDEQLHTTVGKHSHIHNDV